MRFNPRVSVYWLWLVVIAGILSDVPCASYPGRMGRTAYLNVAHLYANALRGYNDSYIMMRADRWILLHAAVSVALAVVATALQHAWAKRRRPDYRPDSKTFTLRGLLLSVAAVACAFSLLASFGAIHVGYAVVLIVVAGRVATLLLAAIGL
jgi:hypothetical protein